jgi:hypothetical protein
MPNSFLLCCANQSMMYRWVVMNAEILKKAAALKEDIVADLLHEWGVNRNPGSSYLDEDYRPMSDSELLELAEAEADERVKEFYDLD